MRAFMMIAMTRGGDMFAKINVLAGKTLPASYGAVALTLVGWLGWEKPGILSPLPASQERHRVSPCIVYCQQGLIRAFVHSCIGSFAPVFLLFLYLLFGSSCVCIHMKVPQSTYCVKI